MPVYTIERTQRLPINLDEAWDFFSSPKNLKEITPDYMGFDIKSDPRHLAAMYPGQIITYTVRPVLGIPMFWMTEITQVRDKEFFIDEQRVGPYRIWHHQHHFKAIEGGVEMGDIVHYQLPLGPLGAIANWLFVKKQLQGIFEYRFRVLEERFGTYK